MPPNQSRLVTLAASNRLPAIYGIREFVDSDGLMSYSPRLVEMYQGAAHLVDKILTGSKSANLSVEPELVDGKWMEPIMAVVASYELIGRGKSLANLRTVLTNLRRHFPGIADTDAIERMLGAPASGPSTPPLFLDGVLGSAMEPEVPEGFHLDYSSSLDYSSPWTIWRSDYPEMLDRDPAVVHPYLT